MRVERHPLVEQPLRLGQRRRRCTGHPLGLPCHAGRTVRQWPAQPVPRPGIAGPPPLITVPPPDATLPRTGPRLPAAGRLTLDVLHIIHPSIVRPPHTG
ncbi:hypothetical protein SSP35_10_00470 [Streptomyces sp. NBRC 110611]|nr:hypothetical protein SSP35_10_00470 [Streptomyces sp. NBRC 110611]